MQNVCRILSLSSTNLPAGRRRDDRSQRKIIPELYFSSVCVLRCHSHSKRLEMHTQTTRECRSSLLDKSRWENILKVHFGRRLREKGLPSTGKSKWRVPLSTPKRKGKERMSDTHRPVSNEQKKSRSFGRQTNAWCLSSWSMDNSFPSKEMRRQSSFAHITLGFFSTFSLRIYSSWYTSLVNLSLKIHFLFVVASLTSSRCYSVSLESEYDIDSSHSLSLLKASRPCFFRQLFSLFRSYNMPCDTKEIQLHCPLTTREGRTERETWNDCMKLIVFHYAWETQDFEEQTKDSKSGSFARFTFIHFHSFLLVSLYVLRRQNWSRWSNRKTISSKVIDSEDSQ